MALYALISIVYFAPQFGGDELVQGDMIQYRGMAQEIMESRERTGKDPQWTGALFGGMPAYMINVQYPSQIIKRLGKLLTERVPEPAAFIFFAMTAMWLMLVMMGMNMWVAILGGVMYGLSTYFFLIIDAGHITKMWALVYAPLMLGSGYFTLRKNIWIGGALLALFTSLQVGSSHPQISYYFLLALGAMWLSEAVFAYKERVWKIFAKRTAVMVAAGVLAVGSNFAPLWYTYTHTPDTMRGGSVLADENNQSSSNGLDLDYATAWSYGRAESFNLLIADFMGRSSGNGFSEDGAVAQSLKPYQAESLAQQIPTYWGTQPFTGGPTYIGAVVLFLAVLGFCLADGRQRWWILGISIFMLLLAWGRNFMWFTELMFNILPGYNKFRTVSMTLVVVELTVPLLAAIGVSRLIDGGLDKRKLNVSLAWAVGLTAGVALLLIAFGRMLFSFDEAGAVTMLLESSFPDALALEVASAMTRERYAIMAADSWRTIGFVVAAAAVVWATYNKFIRSRVVVVALLSVLVISDLVGVNVRFLSYDHFKSPSQNMALRPTAVNRQIWADKELGYRVFNLTVSPFNDATTSYFHRSVGGYHGAKLSRYQDLISNHLSRQTPGVLDMLNTKYLIVRGQDGAQGVVLRESANGAAWFVKSVVVADNPHQEMEMLGTISTLDTAVVERSEGVTPRSFGEGEIALVEYEPGRLVYDYTLAEDGVAVFSEIYYDKGWSVTIDGKPADYFRTDYLLRAMELPAGEHRVVWEFRAPAWGMTSAVTLTSSLLILISLIAALYYERRKKIKA
ncbi:MAG: YfhO family protein [Rikenellaceae bacterium]